MTISDIVGILSCSYFYKKKHCWRSCFITQFLIGFVIAAFVFNFWWVVQSNWLYLYIVLGGLVYGGGAMVYYLWRYGKL